MRASLVTKWGVVAVVVGVLAGCQEAAAPERAVATTRQALASWPSAGQWVSLKRAATAIGDPVGDATGAPGTMKDLQGTEVNPAAFVWSSATQVYFRVRLGATPISGADLAASQWGCLLDTDGRANTWEYAVMVNGQGGDQVEFWKKTTTATLDATNEAADTLLKTYSGLTDGSGVAHAQVTAAGTALGGGADQFLDFAVDQTDLQAAGVTVANAVRVLCGSSSTVGALDDDLLGVGQSLSGQLSDPVALGIDGVAPWVQLCPAGLACYFMPPMLPSPTSAPDGYALLGGGDMVFASPTGAATVTYKFGGSVTTNTLSVASGGKQVVQLTGGSSGFASALKTAETRGVYATSTRHDLLAEQRYTPYYWQSSSTIKADTVALGTRFRVAGYSLNNGTDGSGWDYLAFYAPWATTITITAPSSAPVDIWNTASRTVTLSLTAGQTYILNSKAGSAYPTRAPDIDGTLVTSTAPISLVVGGMGWGYTPAGAGCAGDTGSDGVVPVKYLGTEYVVSKFSATGEEDVRVVADTDGTVVSVNGTAVATLAAGATYKFVPTGVHYITASAPVAVFENTAYINCEADIGFIPPVAFASLANVPSMTVAFNSKGPGTVFVVVPAAQKATVRLDGVANGTETAVPGRADLTTLKFSASTGDHTVTASSDLQVMLVAQDPGGGTGYVGYYSPYRRPGVGNGVLDAAEACDDGNVSDGDGCSSVGEVEAGWACVLNVSGVSVCGCATDTSCATGQYCANGTPNVCTAKVTAGTAIPAGHGACGGSGSLGSAATACASGLCNATTNTCASGAGVACTAASECAGNTCTSNTCVDTVVLTVTPGTTSYTGGGAAMPVDPSLTVTGTYAVTGASVSITSGFVSGQDRLNYTTIGSITGSYDAARGTLTLSGTGTLAQWQTALRSVTYSNSSATPTPGNRTVSISLGTALSNPANGHFYEYVSSAGTWTTAKNASVLRTYMGLKGYLATITSSAENAFITAKLTSDGWIGAQASPETSFPRNWNWVGGPEAGQAFCSNNSSGAWAVLNSLYANWAGGEPNNAGGEGCGQIYFAQGGTWNDLPCNSTSLSGYVVEYGGSAGDPVLAISGTRTVAVSYVATSLTATGTTLVYDQGSGAVVVDGLLTAAGTTTYSSATVALTSGYVSGEDTLAMPTTNGISATFSACTLTLSGVGTTADYQAAFRAVTYGNSVTPRPTTAARNVRYTLGGATANRALQVRALPTVTVSSSSASAPVGNSVTLTATLNPLASTGSVQFFSDGVSLGTATLSSGVASLSTSSLALGAHAITAAYGGDAQRLSATSAAFTQSIVTLSAGQGPCTAGNSATVCSAGLTCNTTTSTCGAPNGGACTAANQCANNVCALNGQCGTQNGGACTAATAALCQSGACSPNANTCIPVGGCAVTADCGPGQQCNTGTLQCETAPGLTTSAGTTVYDATGADVVIDPALVVVGTNAIVGATVTLGTGFVAAQDLLVYSTTNGITGSYNATTGILTLSGSASSAAYQAALRTVVYRNTAGALPSTALRTVTFAIGSAVANGANGHFYEYVSFTGTWTQAKNNAATRSYLGLQGYLATLTSAAENDFVRTKLTNDGWIGAQATPENSYPRTWSWVTGPETGTAFCTNASSGSCVSINSGYSNWAGGEPNNSGGEGCGQIYFVNSGRWNDLPCNSGSLAGYVVEYGGSASDPVLTLSSSKALQVRAKTSLAVSAPASAALHASVTLTATFSPATATGSAQFSVDGVAFGAPVAISGGVASLTTTTLALGAHAISVSYAGDTQDQAATGSLAGSVTITALANGAGPCDASNAATDCASGVCSASGTCGYGPNEGPCTAATAALCQSGACSVGGACMPVGGCYVDADCSGATYCNRATNQCVAKRAAGTAIPNDGLHDGTCHGGASTTCVSGTCNAVTNTCATGLGTGCASAAQCTSNACAPSGSCVPATPGACWADGDCAATDFCNRAAYTCTAKLPSGTAIPSDGLHTGVCTNIAAAPTCATGLCNATTNTCASAVGASCASAAQCQRGTCENGTCGIANGHSGCTAATAYLCQSGACSASGACVPPGTGSCFIDSDCPATDYCDRAHYACVGKASAGAALPNDGALHLGVCTQALAAAVCVSGACNAVTDTCAVANGASCTAAAQCVTNVCGGDGSCGHPAGEGPCTASTAATECRSGFCNATQSACVPSATGCWVDQDCAGGEYCARATYTCTPKALPGTPLPADGLHASCAGPNAACSTGQCNATTNTCAQGNSQPCSGAAECVSNACGANGQCGLANGQAGCTAQDGATLCQSGSCAPSGVCAPSGGCFLDSDCAAGQYCDRASLGCRAQLVAGLDIPSDGLHLGVCDATGVAACATGACNAVTNTCAAANGVSCTSAAQCVTDICGGDGRCGHPAGEGPCTGATAATACRSGFCNASANGNTSACVPTATGCWVDDDCGATEYCARATFTCTAKAAPGAALPGDGLHASCVGGVNAACATGLCNATTNTCAQDNSQPCTAAAQCVSNACGSNGQCGLANGDSSCTAQNAATLCQSGSCTPSGVCAPGGGCYLDSECAAGQYCDRASLTCHGQLLAGTAIPNDGLHLGVCDATGAAVCASGECNATTDTCAAGKNVACATDAQCVSNQCGTNGKCGLADGQAGCSQADADPCQSGTCSSAGVCVPAASGSCWVDGDCTAAQHCRRDRMVCVADGVAGEALVVDTLHDGICSTATAQAVCVTARCNPVENTCAAVNGTSCSAAVECVTDVCGANGKCGFADGQAGCTAGTANRCQSETCSTSGTCMPAAGCWVDADCAQGQWCDRASTTCKAMLVAGTALPSDGLHDGLCSEANATAGYRCPPVMWPACRRCAVRDPAA